MISTRICTVVYDESIRLTVYQYAASQLLYAVKCIEADFCAMFTSCLSEESKEFMFGRIPDIYMYACMLYLQFLQLRSISFCLLDKFDLISGTAEDS